jgi:hypothetical protein
LQILDFGFGIGGIAALYPLIKQAEYLKSKIHIPKSKIIQGGGGDESESGQR